MKCFLPAFLLLLSTSFVSAGKVEFNRDIRPILSEKCYKCHGPDAKNQKSDYRLDSFAHATARLDKRQGISPGQVEKSELHHRIHAAGTDDVMPPSDSKVTLTPSEIALLDQWISEGAEYQQHWAFVPLPKTVPVPKVVFPSGSNADQAKLSRWAKNEIDAFVLEKLVQAGFTPSPEASRTQWLRRVSFDLTGLPPSLAELDAFLADESPEAYEHVVNRLLDSDACAERLTAEWMDVARYSDSYGYQVDNDRRVWPWRDWVEQAFRKNLPYDQFIVWQLAGDLLPDATREQRLATTFNRLHPQNVEGGSVPEEFRTEYVSDRVQTYGTAFLGLTMECARCHDHKFDPVTAMDYFRLSAYFANIDEAGLYSYFTPAVPTPTLWLPDKKQEAELARFEREIASLSQRLASRREILQKSWSSPADIRVPLPKPIASFSFDHLKNGAFPDADPQGESAKSSPNNLLVPGHRAQAVRLTGDDAVTLPVGNFSRDQPFSISLWMNTPDEKERAVIFSRSKAWTDAASRGYEMLLEKGHLVAALVHFEPGNALRIRSKDVFPIASWHHVALVYDGSSRAEGLRLYLDGKPVGVEIVRDQLTRTIEGGGSDTIVIGERMRDSGFKDGFVDDFSVFDQILSPAAVAALASDQTTFSPDLDHHLLTDDAESRAIFAKLTTSRQERSALVEEIPEIMTMEEFKGPPRITHFLERGSYASPGKAVSPATPAFLPAMEKGLPNNRLGLARWTVAEANPLTARVTVNRYWQRMFRNGLVATTEDFGSQGRLPTHPELLDWLARDFVDHGWDLHRLLKIIALSATYRQSSDLPKGKALTADPENTLLHHYPSSPLSAEMLRDNVLATSGLLVNQVGGSPVKPYDIAVAFKPSAPDTGASLYRRSLYTYMRQTSPSPMMIVLNASKRDVCQVKVERSESPLQGLVMLNSPQFVEAARVLAEKLIAEHGDDDEGLIRDAFRRLTSRQARPEEVRILAQLFAKESARFSADSGRAEALLKIGETPLRKEKQSLPRVAAATVLISTLFNYDECCMKR